MFVRPSFRGRDGAQWPRSSDGKERKARQEAPIRGGAVRGRVALLHRIGVALWPWLLALTLATGGLSGALAADPKVHRDKPDATAVAQSSGNDQMVQQDRDGDYIPDFSTTARTFKTRIRKTRTATGSAMPAPPNPMTTATGFPTLSIIVPAIPTPIRPMPTATATATSATARRRDLARRRRRPNPRRKTTTPAMVPPTRVEAEAVAPTMSTSTYEAPEPTMVSQNVEKRTLEQPIIETGGTSSDGGGSGNGSGDNGGGNGGGQGKGNADPPTPAADDNGGGVGGSGNGRPRKNTSLVDDLPAEPPPTAKKTMGPSSAADRTPNLTLVARIDAATCRTQDRRRHDAGREAAKDEQSEKPIRAERVAASAGSAGSGDKANKRKTASDAAPTPESAASDASTPAAKSDKAKRDKSSKKPADHESGDSLPAPVAGMPIGGGIAPTPADQVVDTANFLNDPALFADRAPQKVETGDAGQGGDASWSHDEYYQGGTFQRVVGNLDIAGRTTIRFT